MGWHLVGSLKSCASFFRISSLLYGSFAKETHSFKEPTNRSHPTSCGYKCEGWMFIIQFVSNLCLDEVFEVALSFDFDCVSNMVRISYFFALKVIVSRGCSPRTI